MIKGAEKEVKVVGTPKNWGVELTKKGVFDFKKLYKFFAEWLWGNRYKIGGGEKEYTTKPLPSQGEEIKIGFSGFRDVTTYIRFQVEIEIWGLRVKKIGDIYKGDLRIRFRGWLQKDPEGKWKNFEFFRQLYDLYIIKNKISSYKEKLKKEVDDLVNKTKERIGLITR